MADEGNDFRNDPPPKTDNYMNYSPRRWKKQNRSRSSHFHELFNGDGHVDFTSSFHPLFPHINLSTATPRGGAREPPGAETNDPKRLPHFLRPQGDLAPRAFLGAAPDNVTGALNYFVLVNYSNGCREGGNGGDRLRRLRYIHLGPTRSNNLTENR